MNAVKKISELSLTAFLEYAHRSYPEGPTKHVVVFQKIKLEDDSVPFSPMDLFKKCDSILEGGCILESLVQEKQTGRYSFLAFEPIGIYELIADKIREEVEGHTDIYQGDLFHHVRLFLKRFRASCPPEIEHSATQAIGFITYDAMRLMEKIPDRHKKDRALPEFQLKVYRTTLCFDHQDQSLVISILVKLGENHQQDYLNARDKIESLIRVILVPTIDGGNKTLFLEKEFTTEKESSEMSDEAFMDLVKKAQEEIKKGEVFQVVLSRCVSRPTRLSPLDLYLALREISPVPYLYYLPLADRIIMGASPECMLRLCEKKVTLNPIAGTCQRTGEKNNDSIEKELLSDPKELAEHRMLVDLGRNDLGRVCEVGSVHVKELLKVKHYAHLSHLTSSMSGFLRKQYDMWDALKACFPAGTLSGAPKCRAMELIDQFEQSRRGLYGGAIMRLDHAGNFDSCIAIRMLTLKQGVVTIRTGAGIVHDSIPSKEAAETHHKACSILMAMGTAEKRGEKP